MLLEADWVLPIAGPPISAGAVLVREGSIEAVGPAAQLRAVFCDEGGPVRSFPGCVLMPGFVNVHSHLEYSAFHGFSPSCGFGEWMLRLLIARRRLSAEDYAVSAAWGARECARCGITCIADTSFEGWTSLRAAAEVGLRGRVYLEVIGLDDEAVPTVMERTEARVALLQGERTPLLEVGLSPHAPYTVSRRLYRELARFARRNAMWTATHVAESRAEVELLERGSGSIARAYKAAQLWKGRRWTAPGLRPAAYVAASGGLDHTTLAVHCVQLDDLDIATLAASGAAVAHCPRSNAWLQCGIAPVSELRTAGVRVGLGTDSLASNDSLDMFAEMRAAQAAVLQRGSSAPLSAEEVLRMATLDGARAIGVDELVGSLEVGRRADLTVVRLPPDARRILATSAGATQGSPAGCVVDALVRWASAEDVVATFVDGVAVYQGACENKGDGETCVGVHGGGGLVEAFDRVRARLGLTPHLPNR
jgi:5-methylthioadenosine/S-adenosylhomocysteine deaminase